MMREKLKRLNSLLLVLMILINNFVGVFSENMAYADYGIPMQITDLSVESSIIKYGERFRINGKFGGEGYIAQPGQVLNIPFISNGVNISLKNKEENIYDEKSRILIAKANYSKDGITITFMDGVSDLKNVTGKFFADGQAYNTDISVTNIGTITVGYEEYKKIINVEYTKTESETITDEVYRKSGASDANDTDNVRWAFVLNAAKKSSQDTPYYKITDKLNNDMNWNKKKSMDNKYLVEITDQSTTRYFGEKDLNTYGIKITFKDDKEVEIVANSAYLRGQTITINLYASLTDEVKNNPDKKKVENYSDVELRGVPEDEWKIREEDKKYSLDVYHVGVEAYGEKRYGGVELLKKSNPGGNPIPGVKFAITKKDGSEIELTSKIKQKSNVEISKDNKTIIVSTDDTGVAYIPGIKFDEYKYKEVFAPEYIDFNKDKAITKEFKIDEKSKLFQTQVENKLKEISIPVKKVWIPIAEELSNINTSITMNLKEGDNVIDKLILDGRKDNIDTDTVAAETNPWEGHFKKVPTHKYENGKWKEIKYRVEEQGTKYGTVVLDGDTYKVTVEEPTEKDGQWKVTNTRAIKITVDKTWQKNGQKTENNKKPNENIPDVYFKLQEKFNDNWINTEPKQVIKYEGKRVEFKNIDVNKEYQVVETKDADGKEEWKFEGYQTSTVKKEAGTIEWNFINNYETTNVKVNKKWVGGSNIKPEVYFQLEKNGEKVKVDGQENPLLLPENQDSIEWTNLPKRDIEGKEIKYTVKEVTKEGKDWNDKKWESKLTSGSETNSGPFEFTNINKENVEIYAKKIWQDRANDEHTAPKFKLTRSTSKDIKSEEVNIEAEVTPKGTSNEFSYKWTNLPKYNENGEEYIYNIYEDGVKEGKYIVNKNGKNKEYSVSGPIGEGSKEKPFTITNSYTLGKISINATKVWQGGEGQDRPNVKFQLYKDGKPEGEPKEIKSPEVSVSWTNLEKTKADGTDYKYTVDEVDVSKNYKKSEKIEGDGTSENPFKITNKFIPTSVKVTKTWKNIKKGEEIPALYFQLMNGDKKVGDKKELANSESTIVWENLPKYDHNNKEIEYAVKEVNQDGTDWKFDGYTRGHIEGNKVDGFKVTNTKDIPWTPMEPPIREIKVKKDWKNSKGEALKAPVEKIEVELYKDGKATGKKLELNKANNWSGEFKGLEVAEKLGSTNYYQYTVKEVGESVSAVKLDGKWFKVSYEGSMKDGFNIINKYENPKEPEKPKPNELKEPEKPKRNTPNKNLPKTGATEDSFLYSIAIGISGLALILLGNRKRKKF